MDKCKGCVMCYSHPYYSMIAKVGSTTYRCKAFGHKELKDIGEQDRIKCTKYLLNEKSG